MRDRMMRELGLPALLAVLIGLSACAAPQPPRPTLSAEARARLLTAASGSRVADTSAGALAALRDAAKQRPDDPDLQEQLATAAERAGLAAEAVVARRQVVALGRRNAPALIALGRAELRSGYGDAAAAAFAEAAGLAPSNVEARAGLGLAYDMQGESGRAQVAHRQAISLAPADWGLLGNLSLSQLMDGDAAGAASTLARAETDPAAPKRARHNLGLALGALGQRVRLVRLLGVDMGRADAEAEADDFVRFGSWLATRGSVARVGEPTPVAVARR